MFISWGRPCVYIIPMLMLGERVATSAAAIFKEDEKRAWLIYWLGSTI